MARGNLQVGFSSRAFLGPVQNLHQAELIPALPAAEFYRIHALTYKVQAQPPGAHIFERAPAHFLRIHRHTAIFQDDFKSITAPAVPRHMISMDPFSNLMFFWGQPADATTAPMIHAISLAATRKPAPGLSTRLRCLSHGFM